MSGLLPVLPLTALPVITGPGAVASAEPVSNDIRMPSRAALLQQLGVGLTADAEPGHASAPATATAGETVTLSPAARALSVILDLPAAPASKIMGVQALWPLQRAPVAQLLATTLAHTVENSGLFYESHLQQLAAGTRTLAQLSQEPQARLAAVVGQSALPENVLSNISVAVQRMAPEIASEIAPESMPEFAAEGVAVQVQDLDGKENTFKTLGASVMDATRANALIPAGVHADAVALVRQQLELLAQPVFRWVGEAWPGTPMDWEIHQEQDERAAVAGSEALPQPSWSTRLAVSLPQLKDVEVRLSLVGNTLQLQLGARENATQALLGNGRHELPTRFAALGLQLKGVWVGALASEPATLTGPRDDASAGRG